MNFEALTHPFTPSNRGVCLFPVLKGGLTFVPCGKMKVLHVPILVDGHGSILPGDHRPQAARALGLPVLYDVVDDE